MIRAIKNKIRSIFFVDKNSELNKMIKAGMIEVGANTNIADLKVVIRHPSERKVFLKIGDNCIVSGTIVLETKDARVNISNDTSVGWGQIVCAKEINIGSNVMLSWGFTLMDNDAHSLIWEERKNDVRDWKKGLDENTVGKYKDWSKVNMSKIQINDKAWIGFNTIILKGVTIEEGAIVGSGSVVTKDVPSFTIVAGNPAIIVRKTN